MLDLDSHHFPSGKLAKGLVKSYNQTDNPMNGNVLYKSMLHPRHNEYVIVLTTKSLCTYSTQRGVMHTMPNYRIIVDLSQRMLYLLDNNIVTRGFPVGIGKMLTQSPLGEYTIINKQPNPGGSFGAFWMGLSKPHYGIHGTNDPSSIGKEVSHGCIRMYNEDVIGLAAILPIGIRVTIRE